jgi:hypothetical protein
MEPSFNALIAPFNAAPAAPPPPVPPPPPVLEAPATPPPKAAKKSPPPITRQMAEIDKPERPMPEMKPLVPLPEEWMRSLQEADPKELQPLEPPPTVGTPMPIPTALDTPPNIALVLACILLGGALGYWCFKASPAPSMAAPIA